MRNSLLLGAMALAFGGANFSGTANAALTSGTTLSFTLGTVATISCNYGTTPPCKKAAYAVTDIVGSYFYFEQNAHHKTPIGSLNGIIIGATQAAPDIDYPWLAFNNTGMHQTTSPVLDNGDGTLDMSGWNITWKGIASIPMRAVGDTTITCDTVACGNGESYVVDGEFSSDGIIASSSYFLHLEGTVSSIPVPAAGWLFGSGLLGLIGVARRKKAA